MCNGPAAARPLLVNGISVFSCNQISPFIPACNPFKSANEERGCGEIYDPEYITNSSLCLIMIFAYVTLKRMLTALMCCIPVKLKKILLPFMSMI